MTQRYADETPAELDERVRVLLEHSMLAWGVLARVHRRDDGALRVIGLGREAIIERAAEGAPFRWFVSIEGRKRPAVSVIAVLRQVRLAFDPGYETSRVRVAPVPLRPPSSD
jgi:hypothetical protein